MILTLQVTCFFAGKFLMLRKCACVKDLTKIMCDYEVGHLNPRICLSFHSGCPSSDLCYGV